MPHPRAERDVSPFAKASDFLAAAQAALDAGGFDAARANAAVAGTRAARVVAREILGRVDDSRLESLVLADVLEAGAGVLLRLGGDIRALLEPRRDGVVWHAERSDAVDAQLIASRLIDLARRLQWPDAAVLPDGTPLSALGGGNNG
ncbi:MAG: hypothetical protein L0206_18310 [Actinobacteria bacterium]|nr:hypothetical protein [Actinomycetota bacterium]